MDYNKRRKWKCHQPKGRDPHTHTQKRYLLLLKFKISRSKLKVSNVQIDAKEMGFVLLMGILKCLTSIKKANTILRGVDSQLMIKL